MTFRSESLDGPLLTGALTVGGVTRPVILMLEQYAVSARSFSARATTRIDRTDFGVTAARSMAGRFLDLTIEVRCDRR